MLNIGFRFLHSTIALSVSSFNKLPSIFLAICSRQKCDGRMDSRTDIGRDGQSVYIVSLRGEYNNPLVKLSYSVAKLACSHIVCYGVEKKATCRKVYGHNWLSGYNLRGSNSDLIFLPFPQWESTLK